LRADLSPGSSGVRALVIGALGLSLIGCSRQTPPPPSMTSCGDVNGAACSDNRAVGRPVALTPSRAAPVTMAHRRPFAARTATLSRAHARGGVHLAATKPKSATVAVEASVSRIPVPRASPQPAVGAADKTAYRGDVVNARPAEPSTEKAEASQVMQELIAVATAAADRMTAAAAASAAQPKNDKERPDRAQTVARGDTERAAFNADLLVAILMARPDTRSISGLAGQNIAIDDRYSKSIGTVRTAIVAAGASEIQLSEGPTTAINRLTNAEVPAAVVALVSPDAAEAFPDIAGFKTFRVPLSPRSARARQ
jgi:hypothetical protein